MHRRDITDLLESISETYPVDKLVAVPVGAHFTHPNGIGASRANPSSILNYSQARIGETFLSTSCNCNGWKARLVTVPSLLAIVLAVFVSLILVSDTVSYLSFAFNRICNHKHFIRAATLLIRAATFAKWMWRSVLGCLGLWLQCGRRLQRGEECKEIRAPSWQLQGIMMLSHSIFEFWCLPSTVAAPWPYHAVRCCASALSRQVRDNGRTREASAALLTPAPRRRRRVFQAPRRAWGACSMPA